MRKSCLYSSAWIVYTEKNVSPIFSPSYHPQQQIEFMTRAEFNTFFKWLSFSAMAKSTMQETSEWEFLAQVLWWIISRMTFMLPAPAACTLHFFSLVIVSRGIQNIGYLHHSIRILTAIGANYMTSCLNWKMYAHDIFPCSYEYKQCHCW
jgi:hypothetical protein